MAEASHGSVELGLRARRRSSASGSLALVRGLGARRVARLVAKRLWSKRVAFALSADLAALPEARKARIPVVMHARDAETFEGFDDELGRVNGDDYGEAYQRARMCRAGIESLHVASDAEGAPIYAQWLVDADNQQRLHDRTGSLFPQLAADEMLLEGAYTFSRFRKLGAMADGMNQLAQRARDAGARTCLTYVDADNFASLRGCARAGFRLDHVRVARRVLGRRSVVRRLPEPAEREQWERAAARSH